ncbi:MAG TPA: hypothetical protein VFB62_05965 [Polyangiaceae bacterium]|nr:hypothetical protein [Polyangiaceae bacterium]
MAFGTSARKRSCCFSFAAEPKGGGGANDALGAALFVALGVALGVAGAVVALEGDGGVGVGDGGGSSHATRATKTHA